MMRVLLINEKGTVDISDVIVSVSWSGDFRQVARKLEIRIAVSPTDAFLFQPFIDLGNMLKLLTDDGTELFRGYVFYKEKVSSNPEMQIIAYDGGVYLLKSKMTFNFQRMSPEQITRRVCSEVGVPVGSLVSTGTTTSFIADNQSPYDIIMTAYTAASKQRGKKYMSIMKNGKLNVIEKGVVVAKYTLAAELLPNSKLIGDSTYSTSIENMINRVKIYDDKHNQIGKVENADWIKRYGVLQDAYTKEEDKNSTTVARNMLKGVEQKASLDNVIGDVECITGQAVQVKEPCTGLNGLFYIDGDEHTWEDGQHMMNLELNFQNIMDTKEAF